MRKFIICWLVGHARTTQSNSIELEKIFHSFHFINWQYLFFFTVLLMLWLTAVCCSINPTIRDYLLSNVPSMNLFFFLFSWSQLFVCPSHPHIHAYTQSQWHSRQNDWSFHFTSILFIDRNGFRIYCIARMENARARTKYTMRLLLIYCIYFFIIILHVVHSIVLSCLSFVFNSTV